MSSSYHYGCQWCGGPQNGGNCPGCSIVNTGNEFVYDQHPYNDTTDFLNQSPYHETESYSCEYCGGPHQGFQCQNQYNNTTFGYEPYPYTSPNPSQQSYCCEYCGGPHVNSDCQMQNPIVYEQVPCNNYDYPYNPPPQYQEIQPQPPSNNQEFLQGCFDIIQELKELKELINKPAQEIDLNQKTYRELLAEEAAKVIQYRPTSYYDYDSDSDDEYMLPSGNPTPIEEVQEGKSMGELLAEENARSLLAIYDNKKDENPEGKSMEELLAEENMKCLNESILPFLPQSIDIPSILPTIVDSVDSLIMGDEPLSTIPETESSSVENLDPIQSESEDVSDSDCDSLLCDSLVISEVTSGIFSNPLFEFKDDYTFCEVNPLFDKDFESDSETTTEVVDIASSQSTPFVPSLCSDLSLPSCDDMQDEESDESDTEDIMEIHFEMEPEINESAKVDEDDLLDKPPSDSDREEIDLSIDDLIPPGIEDADDDPEGDVLLCDGFLDSHFSDESTITYPDEPTCEDKIFNPGICIDEFYAKNVIRDKDPPMDAFTVEPLNPILYHELLSFLEFSHSDPSSFRPPAKPPDDGSVFHMPYVISGRVIPYVLEPDTFFSTHPAQSHSTGNEDTVFDPGISTIFFPKDK